MNESVSYRLAILVLWRKCCPSDFLALTFASLIIPFIEVEMVISANFYSPSKCFVQRILKTDEEHRYNNE